MINNIRMSIYLALIAFFAGAFSIPALSDTGFELVSEAEFAQALEAGENPAHDLLAKSAPGGPAIRVVSPQVSEGELASPVDIEVKFESVSGAPIDMSSLKIFYLMFIKKDVTDRILEHAEVGPDSIKALGAKLPSGKHKFLVEIQDSAERKSSEKFIVKVGT